MTVRTSSPAACARMASSVRVEGVMMNWSAARTRSAPIPARVSYIANQVEFTPPVIYSQENRARLVFLVEARPEPDHPGLLHPGQPLEVAIGEQP